MLTTKRMIYYQATVGAIVFVIPPHTEVFPLSRHANNPPQFMVKTWKGMSTFAHTYITTYGAFVGEQEVTTVVCKTFKSVS